MNNLCLGAKVIHFCKNNPGYANIENIELIEEKEVKTPEFNDFDIKR